MSHELAELVLFLDDPETEEEAGLVTGIARVVTNEGPIMVPGNRHLDVPHLAVTSRNLGTFDVTHLPTGTTVLRDFDTMGAALLAMAQLHAIRVRYALELGSPHVPVVRAEFDRVQSAPVPFTISVPAVRLSVGAWIDQARDQAKDWMFPWETPAQLVREAIEMIAMASPPPMVSRPVEVPRVS